MKRAKQTDLKTLVLFDIDGTLLYSKKKYYNSKIRSLIRVNKNILFTGINTQRCWRGSKEIYDYYEMNGPAICEGGNHIARHTDFFKEKTLFSKKINLNDLQKNIISFFKLYYYLEVDFLIKQKSSRISNDSRKIVFYNPNRYATASLYLSNQLEEYAQELKCWFNETRHSFSMYRMIPINKKKLVIVPKKINKFIIMKHIKTSKINKIYYISDDENFSNFTAKNIKLIAVNNATKNYIEMSDYVAKNKGSEGIIEIINYIVKHEK